MCCDSWNYHDLDDRSSPSTMTSISSSQKEELTEGVNDLQVAEIKIWNHERSPTLHPNPSRFLIQRLDSLILKKRMSLISPNFDQQNPASRFMVERLDTMVLNNDLPLSSEIKIWSEQSPVPTLHPNPSRFLIQRLDSLILRKRMSLISSSSENSSSRIMVQKLEPVSQRPIINDAKKKTSSTSTSSMWDFLRKKYFGGGSRKQSKNKN